VRAVEALEHFLARIEKYNPKLNAVVWLDAGRALERAKAADAALAKGEVWGPLHGVPMTIKESYNVAGSPTTWGDPKLANNVTETSAHFGTYRSSFLRSSCCLAAVGGCGWPWGAGSMGRYFVGAYRGSFVRRFNCTVASTAWMRSPPAAMA
jgi:Amidase